MRWVKGTEPQAESVKSTHCRSCIRKAGYSTPLAVKQLTHERRDNPSRGTISSKEGLTRSLLCGILPHHEQTPQPSWTFRKVFFFLTSSSSWPRIGRWSASHSDGVSPRELSWLELRLRNWIPASPSPPPLAVVLHETDSSGTHWGPKVCISRRKSSVATGYRRELESELYLGSASGTPR